MWTTVTVTGFEVEGLNLDGKAHWSSKAGKWQVDEPIFMKTSRITLYFEDSWIGWLLEWFQPFL